ncbi:SARP family transcription regulator [Kutzneria albida DSM 43870]|uniref:SARP family transcription regulator n=1 Tax=Kutzneria albida DSM 43870 TaxID=1449976 RepID=W5W4R7_9PSEU|nr:SARP family transcription regulator [Kutzneria albida DSM 43870]
MEFRVLGPVEARVNGALVPLGGPKPRTLVALLACSLGRAVPVERVIEALWGLDAPERARASLHTYVSALRRSLSAAAGEEVLLRTPGGYRLAAASTQVDLGVFGSRAAEGRRAIQEGRFEQAAHLLDEALAQCRGTVLSGTEGDWAEAERDRLTEERLGVLEDRFEVAITLGRGPALAGELSALVKEYPLRERLRGHLMTALCLAGRQADALTSFQEGRQVLARELGVDPGPALRAIHEKVLRGQIAAAPPSAPAPPAPPKLVAPQQLPPDIADFTGRTEEVGLVRERLDAAGGGAALRVCAISGKPGSGKSTLAVHVAHGLRERFAAGQLYANLRGVHQAPTDPSEVLVRFLRSLGVADTAMPADLDSRVELYRTLLADRRVLVVLDDATDERQVRPLLPGGAPCAVLITSRTRLTALEGADQVDLHVLPEEEAVGLLRRVVGADRAAREPDRASELVRLCGYLPLAVRIAGARLAARPTWPLANLVRRLRVQQRVLHELSIGDLAVRGSLALSYAGLAEQERTALRRLGWLGGLDFGAWLVGALLDVPLALAEDVVEALADAQLVDTVGVDGSGAARYRLHDLTRAFAHERAEQEEQRSVAVAAVDRVARCWLTLVERAAARVHERGKPVGVAEEHCEYLPERTVSVLLRDPAAWLESEQASLVDMVERACQLDLTAVAVRLTVALSASTFSVHNQFNLWWHTHRVALECARRAGDRSGEAQLLSGLGWLRSEQDWHEEAVDYYEQALALHVEIGDLDGQVRSRLALSMVQRECGALAAALSTVDAAVPLIVPGTELAARAGHSRGMVLTELGDLDGAVAACTEAARIYRELGETQAEALVLRSLSIAHRAAGRYGEAAENVERALELLRAFGDPTMLPYAIQALAKVRIRQGLGATVREQLREALALRNEMQDGFGQALVLRTLGELELAEGRLTESLSYLERSLEWWGALDIPLWHGRSLRDLATVLEALGRHAEADSAWAAALAVFQRFGSREAGEPRRRPALTRI